MPKSISLKVDDHIYEDAELIIARLGKSRNRYINEAIEYLNKAKKRELINAQLAKEVKIIAKSSQEVLREFEALEEDYETI